jgi:hypothetical protein
MRAVPDGWRHASSELNAVLFAGRMSDSVQQSACRLCRRSAIAEPIVPCRDPAERSDCQASRMRPAWP